MSDMNDFIKILTDEQKQKLLQILSSETKNQQTSDNTNNVGEDFRVYKTDSKLTQRRKEPVKARRNEWQDTGEFRDIETNFGEKTPRRKEAPKKTNIECHVCGKEFKVDPKYIFGEYYRCNKCGGKK